MTKILAFAASTRRLSLNKRILDIAVDGARAAGAEVTVLDMADYPMPLYNQDLETEQGLPDTVLQLKQLLSEHQGILLASPEYNSAFSPLLKNVIDWTSRKTTEDEPPLSVWKGKTAAILSVSPGARGGVRGLVFVRMLLANIGLLVLPEQETIGMGFQAFDEHGRLKSEEQHQAVTHLGAQLARTLRQFSIAD